MLRRRMIWGAAPMVLLFVMPLTLSLVLLVPGLLDWNSIAAATSHPQFSGALALTLFTGLGSTMLSLLLAISIVSSVKQAALNRAGWFLAVPHLALAIGLGLLIAPTGLVARGIATAFTGWTAPPAWQTVQDPWGFGLMAALVLKEVPFLVWAMAQVLLQEELRERFARETLVARSLGYSPRASFVAVVLPQLLQRVRWPLVAVFSYGMTVVDMALVIGPGQPPTLAQLAWTDLNDADVTMAARGAASTLMLGLLVLLLLIFAMVAQKVSRPYVQHMLTAGPRNVSSRHPVGPLFWRGWVVVYALVVAALLLQSVSLHWPFPHLLASAFSIKAWGHMLANFEPIRNTLVLAFATSVASLALCVVWFETQPRVQDAFVLAAVTTVLCLPPLLLALGQYRLLLLLDWTGSWPGMVLAHGMFVVAYVFVMLQGPYRAYDTRWQKMTQGLGVAHLRFLLKVKWPMLRAPLAFATAVGFAVSISQFVPAQLAAAGQLSTLPMEAVTLSSGGNRALIAVAAFLLMLLPLLAFQLANRVGRARWEHA